MMNLPVIEFVKSHRNFSQELPRILKVVFAWSCMKWRPNEAEISAEIFLIALSSNGEYVY